MQTLSEPAFITDDDEVFEVPDLPEDLGRACALASEATLRKFWDTPQEDEAWQAMSLRSHRHIGRKEATG